MEQYYYCYIADKEGKTVLQLQVTTTDLLDRRSSNVKCEGAKAEKSGGRCHERQEAITVYDRG